MENKKEQNRQEREMEKAVENLLQEMEAEKEENTISDSCQLSSEYLGITVVICCTLNLKIPMKSNHIIL